MKTGLLIILLELFVFSNCFSQEIETINICFSRTTTTNENSEVVNGKIFYQAPQKMILKIIEPINQWMIFRQNEMLIYYPRDQKAFHFTSKNQFSLPFFQSFVGVVKENFGLSESGFTLIKSEAKEDTLFTYWAPPAKSMRILGNTILALIQNKLVLVKVQNSKNKTLIKTVYKNHIQWGARFFPLEIITKRKSVIEKVIYSNPHFNEPLPQEIINFKIPINTKIEQIEW